MNVGDFLRGLSLINGVEEGKLGDDGQLVPF